MKQKTADRILQWIRDNFVVKGIIIREAWISAVHLEAYVYSLVNESEGTRTHVTLEELNATLKEWNEKHEKADIEIASKVFSKYLKDKPDTMQDYIAHDYLVWLERESNK